MSTKKTTEDTGDPTVSPPEQPESQDEGQIAEARQARTTIIALRLASKEAAALERAAEHVSESTSEYVRKAIELRQQGVAIPPTINISSGSFGIQSNQFTTWTEAPDSFTPDGVTTKVKAAKE